MADGKARGTWPLATECHGVPWATRRGRAKQEPCTSFRKTHSITLIEDLRPQWL